MRDDKLVEAMARAIWEADGPLNEWEQAHMESRDRRLTMARAALAVVRSAAPEPVAYRYRFADPISGRPVWRFSASEWNAQRPTDVQPLYAAPQPEPTP